MLRSSSMSWPCAIRSPLFSNSMYCAMEARTSSRSPACAHPGPERSASTHRNDFMCAVQQTGDGVRLPVCFRVRHGAGSRSILETPFQAEGVLARRAVVTDRVEALDVLFVGDVADVGAQGEV